ncbi:D-alanyl-D-alanine carboxypeptidase (penicillin-binding protein 5/6) [Thermosyntropha lipolytica DSM 11003]|uniref:serine-type D-Ala-D-Ala carboxypeptidase n=1 Tax=Thermosyntropha lipolytica DSM 11003 TaxID=1123382 RepID=A0A1M5R354_9FIRM|nr:D-alanyl-D-alanine carboxypeptidase family protein [Thermosyntropha lipolytica]SHH20213.1 D-alanyl-D-alanine carboxypeptidase (penicillin-binding protein 5/6) [Thermosyntropha lipolytica DSM 11003]
MNKAKKLKKMGIVLLLAMLVNLAIPAYIQAEPVDVKAESYVLMDADSGKVLLAKNEHKKMAPASMTKLMTLILAFQDLEAGKVGLKDKVVASENAWKMGGSQIYLEPGEEMTFEDMLIAIAVGSANDACVAVAEHLEGTEKNFVVRMNAEAKRMGLKNTHFVNSHGLTADNHYTTAYDMAVIARYALKYPKLLEYCSIKEYNLRQGEFKLFNTNKLLWWYEGADGFKTGYTDKAKFCLTSTAKRNGLRLIAVVMASPKKHDNFRDSMQLLNYGFARYSFKTFFAQGSVCGTVKVGKGISDRVEVVAEENVGTIVEKGQEKTVTAEKILASYVNAPVEKGQKLGEMKVYRHGELVKTVNLLAAQEVSRAGWLKQIMKMFAETYLL